MALRLFQVSEARQGRISGNGLVLRFPEPADFPAWRELRAASLEFLKPWEPRWPDDDLTRVGYRRRLRRYRRDHELGLSQTWFVFGDADKALYGGLTLSGIKLGAARSAQLGYWMGAPHAGKGIMKKAAALLVGEAFNNMSLERIEAACLPDNLRSSRLLRSLGFQQEGVVRSYLEIDGVRRDHALFALLKSDVRDLVTNCAKDCAGGFASNQHTSRSVEQSNPRREAIPS